MATEDFYDEAEPFQGYSPSLSPQHDIYSNSAELNLVAYNISDDCLRTPDSSPQPYGLSGPPYHVQVDNISNNGSHTSADAIEILDDELAGEKEKGSNGTPPSHQEPWKLKLRNNWKRHLRKKAAAGDQKSKKSDSRDTFGGSLSRSVSVAVLYAAPVLFRCRIGKNKSD